MAKAITILHLNNSWTAFLSLVAPLFSDPVPNPGPPSLRPAPGKAPVPRVYFQPGCGACPPFVWERQYPYPKDTNYARIRLFPPGKE